MILHRPLANIETRTDIKWESFVTPGGKKYEVGHLDVAKPTLVEGLSVTGPTSASTKAESESDSPLSYDVNWPVGTETAKSLSGSIKDDGHLEEYELYKQTGLVIYDYILYFHNFSTHYDYTFTDESKDTYLCITASDGWHYVKYNSDKPTIKKVLVQR